MARRGDSWIASRSLSSGARSRDPLARNDGVTAARVRGRPEPDLLSIAAFPGTAKPIMVPASLPQDEAG